MFEVGRLRLLYHYTSPIALTQILVDQQIRAGALDAARSPIVVVWLTDATDPGRGNDHGLGGPGPDGSDSDKRGVRITVAVADAQRWSLWSRHNVNDKERRRLDDWGGGLSQHWWIVNRPLAAHEWVRVENLLTGEVVTRNLV